MFDHLLRLGVCLALVSGVSPLAGAQFDDDFDDEFEEEPEAPAEAPAESPAGGDDDGFDDADDGFDDPDEDDGFDDFDDADGADDADDGDDADADADEDDADEDEDDEEAYRDPRDDPADARRLRMFNTFHGPTGGFHLVDAYNAPAGTFRTQLGIEFFAKDGFLQPNDSHSRVGGTLSLSYSPHDMVEVYAGIISYATSNTSEFPNLLIVLGDVLIGTKVGTNITPVIAIGGDVGFNLTTSEGLGVAFDSMGVNLRAALTADLRGREDPIPLLVRLNLGYRFDRSERLIDDIERARYDQLADPLVPEDETRHLISRAERNGLGINRTDFFDIGIGLQAPIEASEDIHVEPILEYRLGIPVNRQGYDCPFVPAEPGGSAPREGDDDCWDRVGFKSIPSSLTLGVRVLPPVRGLGTWLGFDIGLTGRSRDNAVRELSQTPPWRLLLGLSYAHDARSAPVPEPIIRHRDVEVEIPSDAPPQGRIRGRVLEAEGDTPVANAIIDFPGREETSLMADEQGGFVTYPFDPETTITMGVSGDGMHPGQCEATIPEDASDVEVVCRLERQLVAVEDTQVVILEQIQFAFDSAEILEASFGLMTQIKEALAENPQIRRVEIQGHTDDQGTHEYNADLSQRRAESVRDWLVEHGIAAARLSARGYGETVPLIREETDEARAANRRVEFRIQERSE